MQADLVPLINQIHALRARLAAVGLPAGSIIETQDTIIAAPNLRALNGSIVPRHWFPELDAVSPLQGALVSVTLLDPPGYTGKLHWMGGHFATEDRAVVRWNGTALTNTVVGPVAQASSKVVGFLDWGSGARKFAVVQTPGGEDMESFQLWTTDAGGTTWSALSTMTMFPRGFSGGQQRYRMGVFYSDVGKSKWAVNVTNGFFFIQITPMLDDTSVAGPDEIWRWDPNNASTPLVFVSQLPNRYSAFVSPQGGWLGGSGVVTHYSHLPYGESVIVYPSTTGPVGPADFSIPNALLVNSNKSILGMQLNNDWAAQMPLWNRQAEEAQPGSTVLFTRANQPMSFVSNPSLQGTSFNYEHNLPIAATAWFMGGTHAVDAGTRYIPLLVACVGFNSWHLIEHSSFATGYDDWMFNHGVNVLDSANPSQQCTLMHLTNGLTSKIAKIIMDPANEFGITLPNVPASGGYKKWIAPGASLQFVDKAPGDRYGGGG